MGVAGAEGGGRREPAFAESAAGPLGGHVVSMVCPWSFYGLGMRFLRTGQAGAWRSQGRSGGGGLWALMGERGVAPWNTRREMEDGGRNTSCRPESHFLDRWQFYIINSSNLWRCNDVDM